MPDATEKGKQIALATAVLRANGYTVVPPAPTQERPARVALLALARMTFTLSEDKSDWPDARVVLRRLAREALVAVGKKNQEANTDAR